jgi:2-keto-4-pentenoate hydratase/2-oxohepta-3-ene-1,7-dioic acid hydratase in catechol pathway
VLPLDKVRLRPPRPGKILACIANYWEQAQRETRPLNMFMKNPEPVIGPVDTIVLPEYTVPDLTFMLDVPAEIIAISRLALRAWAACDRAAMDNKRSGRHNLRK